MKLNIKKRSTTTIKPILLTLAPKPFNKLDCWFYYEMNACITKCICTASKTTPNLKDRCFLLALLDKHQFNNNNNNNNQAVFRMRSMAR